MFLSFIDFFLSSFLCFFQIPVAVRGTECVRSASSRFAAPTLTHQLPDLISSLFPLFRSLLELFNPHFLSYAGFRINVCNSRSSKLLLLLLYACTLACECARFNRRAAARRTRLRVTRAPPRGRRVQCRTNHQHTHASGITHATVWGSQERENLHFLELSASFPVSYNSPIDPELDLHDLGDL